jgi:hypothetical protein
VHAPCAPADCDIAFAPDSAHMRPASPWAPCGVGCLELVDDWAATPYRFFNALGAARDGKRWISYERNLGPPLSQFGGYPLEIQIVRLPENVVTFDAIMPDGLADGACTQWMHALAPDAMLLELFASPASDFSTHHRMVYSGDPDHALPVLSFERTDGKAVTSATASSQLWAVTYDFFNVLEWHPSSFTDQMAVGWTAPGAQTILASTLASAGATVFFSTAGGASHDILAWDLDAGGRALLGSSSPSPGAACCLGTDGKDMAWLQGSGWPPNGGVADTFDEVWLFTSPQGTTPQALQPRPLRKTIEISLTGSLVVGGGYVLASELQLPGTMTQLTLTRISDGAYWVIPAPSGFAVGSPLYVDAEEFAYLKSPGKDLFIDAGLQSGAWTIVRQTIAALGSPLAADAGP